MRQHVGMTARLFPALFARRQPRAAFVGPTEPAPCDSRATGRYKLTQGKPLVASRSRRGLLVLAGLLGAGRAPAWAACDGAPLRFEPVAAGLWLLPAQGGEASADNRGQVSNLLLAIDGDRLWLLGSGPSPAFGRRLSCAVRERFGRAPTDVVSPWPRPELVLGLAGLPGVRAWAHAAVAQAMRAGCAGCAERLRLRIAAAAGDLGDDPIRIPDRMFDGQGGTLGPWRWQLLSRGEGHPVTVWQHRASGVCYAPGLLWGGSAPDGRDADLDTLAASTAALARKTATRWIGEQGPPLGAPDVKLHVHYWDWLLAAARRGVEDGGDETRLPVPPPPLAALAASPLHALNWQRAWRQAESRWLQRSLR